MPNQISVPRGSTDRTRSVDRDVLIDVGTHGNTRLWLIACPICGEAFKTQKDREDHLIKVGPAHFGLTPLEEDHGCE